MTLMAVIVLSIINIAVSAPSAKKSLVDLMITRVLHSWLLQHGPVNVTTYETQYLFTLSSPPYLFHTRCDASNRRGGSIGLGRILLPTTWESLVLFAFAHGCLDDGIYYWY